MHLAEFIATLGGSAAIAEIAANALFALLLVSSIIAAVTVEDKLHLVGTTLEGKYRIDEVVASGGFALVYRATHLVWKRAVAVKAFFALADLPEESRAKLVEEFLREGALLAELSERSAAIVQARDVGTLTAPSGDRVPYMILEWLDGATLETVLRDERERHLAPRSVAETIALLDPIAEALGLAHRKGIAHRDVKPPNIYILGDARSEQRTLKLLDFGIAKVVQDAQKMAGSFTKTAGNVTSFTPAYGAPEQFSRSHGSTGPWTDVFALALVVSEVISGHEPLQGESFVQLGYASADRSRRPTPRTLGATVPDAVEEVLAKALAVEPQDRFQTAGELWTALRTAAAMSPVRTQPEPAAFAQTQIAPPTEPKRPFPVALIGVVALVLVAGGTATVLLSRDRSKPMASQTIPSSSAPAPMMSAAACPKDAVIVPGGPYFQGTDHPPDGLGNEAPSHSVTLSPFCIDKYEVSVERYAACSDAGHCSRAARVNYPTDAFSEAQHHAYDPLCNENERAARHDHPINCVSWEQARRFCESAGGHLPTEAQWELAARGQDGRLYPWGDDPPGPKRANGCGTECLAWAKEQGVVGDFPGTMYDADDGHPTTAPVGSFPGGASRWGVEDVVGNVWEWTADYYGAYPKDAATLTDPTGPATGTERVIRGGAWNAAKPEWARPTYRFHAMPDLQTHGIGFRCAYPAH